MDCNRTEICGTITEIGSLRYSPAGVAVVELKIRHVSRQVEAGKPRQVECEVSAIALAQIAETIAGLVPGTTVKLAGFLARKSRMSLQLALHVNRIDPI